MRPWAYLRALLGGYFWLPCPVCARMFGGHECHHGRLHREDGRTSTTCPRCPGTWVEFEGRVWEWSARRHPDGAYEPVLLEARR